MHTAKFEQCAGRQTTTRRRSVSTRRNLENARADTQQQVGAINATGNNCIRRGLANNKTQAQRMQTKKLG